MARTLDADQQEKVARDHIHPITLVVLTTYTDRLAATVDTVYYLADHPFIYDYGNGGTDRTFLPVIVGGRTFTSEMVHLPDPADRSPYAQSMEIGVTNLEISGTRFVTTLQAHALEGATVEVSQLLVAEITKGIMDHSAMTGDEHTVLFRGRINSVAPITETQFTLNCGMNLPSMADPGVITDTQVDSMDDVTDWNAIESTIVQETTIVVEGTGSIKVTSDNVTFENSMESDVIAALDITGLLVSFKALTTTPFFNNKKSGGAYYLRVSSDTNVPMNDDYATFLIDDDLVTTVGLPFVTYYVNPALPPFETVGTPVLSSIRVIQLGFRQEAIQASDIVYFDDLRTQTIQRGWIHSTNAAITDPRDVGVRWPIVYGEAKRVRAINHIVGWQTTLAAPISATDTVNVQFTELGGGNTGTWRIGLEELTLTKVDNQSGTLSNRGSSGTRARAHAAGEIVIEMVDQVVFGFGGHACDNIQQIYMVNPASGELIRTPDLLTFASGGDPNVPGLEGRPIAVAKVDQTDLRTVIVSMLSDVDFDGTATVIQDEFTTANVQVNQSSPRLSTLSGATGGTPRFTGVVPFSGDSNRVLAYWSGLGATAVVRWRIKVKGNADMVSAQAETGNAQLLTDSHNIPGSPSVGAINFPDGVVTTGATAIGGWHTPPGGTVLSDLNGTGVASDPHLILRAWDTFIGQPSIDPSTYVEAVMAGIGLEVETVGGGETTFIGATVGFGVEVYADVDGYVAPDDTYKADEGKLIKRPCDALKHHIELYGESIDATSYNALNTALFAAGPGGGPAEWAGDLRPLGRSWEEILQRLAFEARANVVAEQEPTGREWRMLSAGSGYGFGTTTNTIDEWQSFEDQGRAIRDLATAFLFHYNYDPALAYSKLIEEDLFAKTLEANKDTSAVDQVTAANIETEAKNFGVIEALPYTFLMIQDTDTAADVAGYLVQERMASTRRVFEMRGVPWYQALPRIVGDLVNVTPPWKSSSTLCRIISMKRDFVKHTWDIVAVQVVAT